MAGESGTVVSPLHALLVTIAGYFGMAVLNPGERFAFAILLTTELCFIVGTGRPISLVLKWTLPFVVPLLIIHGMLNGTFHAEGWLLDWLPYRPAGFAYGLTVSINILLLATVAVYWLNTTRDEMTESLITLKLPLWVLLFASQSVAIAATIERRVAKVYLAQTARGIRVGPNLTSRIKALPSILVPVVVSTFLEAEGRIPALASRGFGSGKIAPLPSRSVTASEHAKAASPVAMLILVWIVQASL